MVIGLPPGGLTPAWEKDFTMYAPAGVIIFARDFRDLADLRRLTARLRELAHPRRIFLTLDEEGGWVSQLAGHLPVPPNAALLARGAAPGDLEYFARVTGERLRALGFDWVFAPVADVHSEPHNPVIGPRAWGTTPGGVGAALADVLAGLQASEIASCLKHFPGHGDTRLDSHLTLPVCDADRATLESRELSPFRAHLAAPSMMSAHVVYPALDPALPATFSRPVITGLLRGTLGYRGLVVTDALEMQGAAEGRTPAEAGALALSAGCDLLLYAHWTEEVRRARLQLADALVDGQIDHAAFDDARPRLVAFDAAHPQPTAAELARPLDSLTPPDFEPRLAAIIDRGLRVEGTLPDAACRGPWQADLLPFAGEHALRTELADAGLAGPGTPTARVIAITSRRPLDDAAIADLRTRCTQHPTILVGLQNDAFLTACPEAAVRLSASDCTPLTRRRVVERLKTLRGAPSA